MAAQQAEPRMQSFGLSDDIQVHDDEGGEREVSQKPSSKRRVAVSRRGQNSKRSSVELEDTESNEGDIDDIVDDLDASNSVDDSSGDDGADDDGDDDDTNDVNADEGDSDDEDKSSDNRGKDARTRGQWKEHADKQATQIEELQRRLDSQDARNAQAIDAQSRRAKADNDPDDSFDELFDEITGSESDGDEFVTAAQVKTRDKQKKKMHTMVEQQVDEAVNVHAIEDIRVLFAIPGAQAAYNEARKSGAVDRLQKDHKSTSALVYAIVKEQQEAQIKKLTAKHKSEIGKVKEELRRIKLGEIPATNGAKGSVRTGTGSRSSGFVNDMVSAMDDLSKKQGLSNPRQ